MDKPGEDLPPETTPLDNEAGAWVMRFAGGKGTSADLESFKQWAARSPDHAASFDRASRAWQGLGPLGREMAAEGVFAGARRARRAALGRRAFIGGALAATAAVLVVRPPLGLWPSWSERGADYRTEVGEQRNVDLSGQVSILLNTRTSIADDVSGAGTRLIAGEVLIAASGTGREPFALLAGDGRILAETARFNTRINEQGVCVTCIEGEVRVEQGSAGIALPAGRQLVYADGEIGASRSVDLHMVTAWRDGVVIFQSTPIREVVAEVNRYRSGRIILTDAALGRRLFNARLRIEHVDRVVSQIVQAFGAGVTELPGGIVLLG